MIGVVAAIGVGSVLAGVVTVASDRMTHVVDGVALALFGWLINNRRQHERADTLAAAHAADGYDVFESRTLLAAVAVGSGAGLCVLAALPVARSLLGAVGTVLGGTPLGPLAPSIQPGQPTAIGLTVAASVLVAGGVGVATHELRWWLRSRRVATRTRRIEATLPRAVAVMYALSRSGMPLPRILRLLADNDDIYGAAATELGVAVREIETFGRDPITALATVGERTPSEELAEFTESLANVLTSGRSLPTYLRSQHDRYRDAAATEQQQYLDLLSICAEGYVTVLVVGPLFVITTLTVVGLVVTETLTAIRLITFGGLPLATAGVLLGLDRILEPRRVAPNAHGRDPDESRRTRKTMDDTTAAAAGQWNRQRATLQWYDQLKRGHRWLRNPVAAVTATPWLTLLVTVPVGVLWLALTVHLPATTPVALVTALARPLSVVAIGVCGVYAGVYELAARRRRRIERAVPEFLDRLGGLNDAGMSVIGGLKQVSAGDLGPLTPEAERLWRDVQLGASAETALQRLAGRVRSPQVTGAVTLVTNALRASSDIAPVLSIAADELRASQRLARTQTRMMSTYLLVIYVAVAVFVGIVAALSASFVPALETAARESTAAAAAGGAVPATAGAGGSAASAVGAYESLFFQIAVVQAGCSGLVAGKLGAGRLRAGVKHVALLLCLVHVGFVFV